MKEICRKESCTGCGSCINACRRDAIKFVLDDYGVLLPTIDSNRCIDCGLCQKVCPSNKSVVYNYPEHVYAAWVDNQVFLSECATGGIGTLLSEYVIRKSGVVYGTCYSKEFSPIMQRADSKDVINLFKGSKYAHSNVGLQFRNIKMDLEDGKDVLVISTPCQIAGLLLFLHKHYQNLTTIDLLCHGVASASYLGEELNSLKEKCGDFDNVRFRGNDGMNYKLSLWKGGRCIYKKSCETQYYFWGFVSGYLLRPNCFDCRYAKPERVSDITIGDFIGLGSEIPFVGNPNNRSFVSCNTEKGARLYQEIVANNKEVVSQERDYSERLRFKPSLLQPANKPKKYDEFRNCIKEKGYLQATRLWFKDDIRKNTINRNKNALISFIRSIFHKIKIHLQ